MITKVLDAASVVLVGSFNPKIFHPIWFEKQGLLPQVEVSDASIEVISNEFSVFELKWARIEVANERFSIRTTDTSKFGPLCDLAASTFRILEHTPISQMGLNHDIQFEFDDRRPWDNVGHSLAPKELWLPLVQEPGMKSVSMQTKRDDSHDGCFNIIVRPVLNQPLPVRRWLVEVAFNDHIVVDDSSSSRNACDILESDWEKSIQRSERIATQIVTTASKKDAI